MKNIVTGIHMPQWDCDCCECDKYWDSLVDDPDDENECMEIDEEDERQLDLVFEQDGT